MKQILVEVDDETAARLDEVAPTRSRKRSEFIRAAIRRALWELQERATEEAYRRLPDTDPVYFDPGAWEAREPRVKYRKRTRR